MNKRFLVSLLSSLTLVAAGCTHASSMRTARADTPAPNYGGDDIDPSSERNNTDPAVASPYDPRNPVNSEVTDTGSGPQQQ